tara:strand:- start:16632 stop:16928 length:297 start_codon:yes stop_codon:yes gene_type:complete
MLNTYYEKRTVKVNNMLSNNGNRIANQFEIQTDDGLYFQSYESIIAIKPNDGSKIILDEYYWNYSRTTGKYRNIFLNESKADTQKKIDSGEYLLADLN